MTIPTTPLKLPIQGKPLDEEGNWTPTWARTLQLLFNRVGSFTAPSNLQLAGAIGAFVSGPAAAVNSNIVVFDGITGKLVKDGGTKVAALATLASPTFTGTPLAPTATAGTSTTQIATTAFVGTAIASAGNVNGPVSSVNNDIALFNGTTGKLITDSGVQLSALAPIASPALTGIPTAPTAAVGDNTTQLATTAFVKAAFGTASSFSAHNNGVAQSIPASTFTKLNMSTSLYNSGGMFAASAWTPPPGLFQLFGNGFTATIANSLVIVSIFKNGAEFKRGTTLVNGGTNTASAHISCMDVATGSDVYDLRIYQDTGAAQNTNGATMLTWFQGATLH